MKWGIMGAMSEEVALLRDAMQLKNTAELYGTRFFEGSIEGQEAVLVCCSVGKVNAALCAAALIRDFGAGCVVNVGIAGAMAKHIGVLDVVISSKAGFHDTEPLMESFYPFRSVFEADPSLVALAEAACEAMPERSFHHTVGLVGTGDLFVSSAEQKSRIAALLSPACVEMEGAAVAQAAYMNNTPFVIIRTMSDAADDDAGEHYDHFKERAANQSAAIVLGMLRRAHLSVDKPL